MVTIYQHCNYQGWSASFPVGDFNAIDLIAGQGQDNDASSVQVSPGFEAHLFKHDEQVGVSVKVIEDTACLTEMSFNDVLSSFTVQPLSDPEGNPNAAVCFYEKSDFNGGNLCVNPGSYDLPGAWNDKVSSLTVADGYRVELYENTQQQGGALSLTNNTANLATDSFDNSASSYRITRVEDTCLDSENCELAPDVTAISVRDKTSGGNPQKGNASVIAISLNNTGQSGWVRVTPYLTSARFTDYSNVELPSIDVKLNANGETVAEVDLEPFIFDLSTQKHYAVGHGNYEVNRVKVVNANGGEIIDSDYSGKTFNVEKSNAVLPIVVYDAEYFDGFNYNKTPATYINEVFTRTAELYNPADESLDYFAGGFDEMMDVRHVSHPVPGLTIDPDAGGTCEQAVAYVEQSIGVSPGTWGSGRVETSVNHHGFDYAIALSDDQGGGVACGWINVQVSGYIGTDLDRLQIIAVHESGHLFGAPHCDPIQGYVMCSGEKHEHYQDSGIFVWHQDSRDVLSNRFD